MAGSDERFARSEAFFGKDGQAKLAATHAVLVGWGGLGSHAGQQLALNGVGKITVIDPQTAEESNRNRYIGLWHDDPTPKRGDPTPGLLKVDMAERLIKKINPCIVVKKVSDTFISRSGFDAIEQADWAFGCLDMEGARLILNEVCAATGTRYLDLASEIIPGESPEYGGRVFVNAGGPGCMVCCDVLDEDESRDDLLGPQAKQDRGALYGVDLSQLKGSGPSVVSLNGVVASLAVTEFCVAQTGLRSPHRQLTYYAHKGIVTLNRDEPRDGCYACSLRSGGSRSDVDHWLNEPCRDWLR